MAPRAASRSASTNRHPPVNASDANSTAAQIAHASTDAVVATAAERCVRASESRLPSVRGSDSQTARTIQVRGEALTTTDLRAAEAHR